MGIYDDADGYLFEDRHPRHISGKFQPALRADSSSSVTVELDEEVSDALYEGLSLADIAEANGKKVQDIIDLQVAQLSEQLYLRMESGQLTPSDYQAQLLELRSIVADSIYGKPKAAAADEV